MRRCEKHGRYGCADYECQRAESARAAGPAIEHRDTPPAETQADATTTGQPERVLDDGEGS